MTNESHGDEPRERVRRVLEAILDYKENNFPLCDSLSLICNWKEKGTGTPQLLVQGSIRDLLKLTSQDKYEKRLNDENVRQALHLMENFLEILDDHRVPPKRGKWKWHFTLSLWSKHKETNLERFTQEWQRKWEQKHPKKSKQKKEFTHSPKINSTVQPQLSSNDIKKNIWSDERIETLLKARNSFIDMGQVEEALKIADLLLERSELYTPLREEIETFRRTHKSPWRQEIDNYIHHQQPFQLTYQNAKGELLNFNVHYATVALHEDRHYLDCWCEEREGNFDLEQLSYNRSLLFERISEVKASPDGEWLSDLGRIIVTMHLSGNLLDGYKPKKNVDIINKRLKINGQEVRKVLRKVSSTFWFFREVIRYGENCVIVEPDSVRERFEKNLISLCKVYSLTIPN